MTPPLDVAPGGVPPSAAASPTPAGPRAAYPEPTRSAYPEPTPTAYPGPAPAAYRGPAPEVLGHPQLRLAAGVEIVAPLRDGGPWIIQDGPERYFRITADVAAVATALDGRRGVAQVAAHLGPRWSPESVETVVTRLQGFGLLGDRPPREPTGTSGRWRYVPPLTVQFRVLDPAAALAPLAPLIRVVMSRPGLVAQTLLTLAGLAALGLRPTEVWLAATTPLPLTSYGVVALAFVLATAIHEFGHGAVLTGHGGHPHRMGVMLFYLAPAFFCDVSDGWRLPHRWQRVQIAMSGISTQALVGSVAALASCLSAAAPVRSELILFASGAFLGGLLNLIPFVKFDGYLALMSHVDVPRLREKAMADARQFLGWVLIGTRRTPALPQFRWTVAYGIGCLLFPFVLVTQGVSLWATALSQIGILGLVGMLVGIGGGILVVARGWRAIVVDGLRHGASRVRIAVASTLLVGAAIAGLVGIQVPRVVQGGYFTDAAGLHFILPAAVPEGSMTAGDPVDLFRSGIFGRQQIGTTALADPTPAGRVGPISAVAPVTTTLTTTYARTVPLAPVDTTAAPAGIATWTGPRVPLWVFIRDTYLLPLR